MFVLRTCLLVVALCAAVEAAQDRRTPVVLAVEKARKSVVNIGTERIVRPQYDDLDLSERNSLLEQLLARSLPTQPRESHSLGSGIIVDENGYILTNYHVIDKASRIQVMLDDDSVHQAVLVAGDPVNDLAVIRVDTGRLLEALPFAADDDVLLGETVIAMGNPFGLANTVTVGVLSAKNRKFRYNDRVLYNDILQTDAAINFGSSGGPLININGEMIGVSVSVNEEAQNIGFAVPVRRVREFLSRALSPLLLRKMWLGFDLDLTQRGVRLGRIGSGSTAEQWGLRPGDEVLSVAGEPMADVYAFNRALNRLKEGDRVRLAVRRGELTREVELAFVAMPRPSGAQLALRRLGLEFAVEPDAPANEALSRAGLPIRKVASDSPAARAGLGPGIYLSRIGDVEVRTLDDVGIALENVATNQVLALGLTALSEVGQYTVRRHATITLPAM